MDDETNNTISNTRHSRYYSGFFVGFIHDLERDMMRIPLPLWLLAINVAAYSFFFGWYMEQRYFFLSLVSVAGFTLCLDELVRRLVEHFRDRRR